MNLVHKLLIAVVLVSSCQAIRTKRCEDAEIDCAKLDMEHGLCKDSYDALMYCPKYCGVCQEPTPDPICRDYDHQCPVLANTQYCQTNELATNLCPKSCKICGTTTTSTTTTTTTTTTPTTTTVPTTTTPAFTEIPDPACQDIDPDCITLLQAHFCGDEPLVRKLCQRSCRLCPTVLVPVKPDNRPEVSTPYGPKPVTPDYQECKDYDASCPDLVDECGVDMLITRTCKVTCNVPPCNGATMPTMQPGSGNTDGQGITMQPGSGNTDDSGVTMQPGMGNTNDQGITMQPGNGNTDGQGMTMQPGNGNTDGQGVTMQPGNGNTDGQGMSMQPGNGNTDGQGMTMQPGSGNTDGQGMTKQPGDGNTSGQGLTMQPGNGNTDGQGMTMQPGNENTDGQGITKQPGNGNTDGQGVTMQPGNGNTDGQGVTMQPGNGNTGNQGMTLQPGNGNTDDTGITMQPGGGNTVGPGVTMQPGGGNTDGQGVTMQPGGGNTDGQGVTMQPGGGNTNGQGVTMQPGGGNTDGQGVTMQPGDGNTDGQGTQSGDEATTAGKPNVPTEPVTPPPTLPTLKPYQPAPGQACRDNDKQCYFLLRTFYCDKDPLVGRICPRSCGLCDENSTDATLAPGETTPDMGTDQCMDIDLECPYLLMYCTRTDLLVSRLCKKSCGTCGIDELTTPDGQNMGGDTTVKIPPSPGNSATSQQPGGPTGPVVPSPTLPTLKPYQPPSQGNCQDKDKQCYILLRSFYCNKDPLVSRICTKSCGLCDNTTGGADVSRPTLAPGETTPANGGPGGVSGSDECVDYDTQCPELLSYCSRTDLLVNRLCKKSCGTCDIDTPTDAPVAPPTVGQLAPYVIPDDCSDLYPNCDAIARDNPCSSNDLVNRICPVTCRLCNGSSTTKVPGQVSPPCEDYDPECSTLQSACGAVELVDKLCPLTCGVCKGPLKCRICTDPFCDGSEAVRQCPSEKPLCFNTVVNDVDGTRHTTKRCGSEMDCINMWVNASSTDTRCQFYDINNFYNDAFTCHYCCTENNCNSRVVPLEPTLYRLP